MNTELRLEVYKEMFNGLPTARDGKKLTGITYRVPEIGDCILRHGRTTIVNGMDKYAFGESVPQLILHFEDTHREDGTPMGIAELPEVVGANVSYITGEEFEKLAWADLNWAFYNSIDGWSSFTNCSPTFVCKHYALAYKIAQPTTLADLFEGGMCWLHHEAEREAMLVTGCNASSIQLDGSWHYISSFQACDRWSNNPLTTFEDANAFIA